MEWMDVPDINGRGSEFSEISASRRRSDIKELKSDSENVKRLYVNIPGYENP